MKEAFEAMLGAFLFAVMMIVCVSATSTFVDARNIDATMQSYVAEVEHSNFSPTVIASVLDEMDHALYEDSDTSGVITLYGKAMDGTPIERSITSSDDTSAIGDTSGIYMAKIELTYTYGLDFLDRDATHTLTAYAR